MAPEIASAEEELSGTDLRRDRRWRDIQRKVREYIHESFHRMGAASARETRDLERGLDFAPSDEEELRGWETFCDERLPEMLESAHRTYHDGLMNTLLDLYNQQPRAISLEAITRWDARFRDPTVDYKVKEKFIKTELPRYAANWKAASRRRLDLLAEAKHKGVALSAVAGLQDLLGEEAFLRADYDKRLGLLQKAESLLAAEENGMPEAWKAAQEALLELTVGEGCCLHRSKVGQWLKRMMDACKTPHDVTRYMAQVLGPLADNWRAAASRYDTLHAAGLPPSFKAVSREKFLLLHYDDRLAYLEELELSQQAAERTEPTALEEEKKGIRYDIAAEDFDEAERKLAPLLKEHPSDPDLRSMRRTLDLQKAKRAPDLVEELEEEAERRQLLSELRAIAGLIPAGMRWMYEEAMQNGPAALRRLEQVVYNRKWARDNGYSNELDEVRQSKSDANKEETRQYVDDGHTDDFERIVIEGDTTHEAAIRDECKEAQVLYVASADCRPVMTKVLDNKDNEGFGYWTTLVFTDVDYGLQAGVIQNLHYPLLSRLRRLDALGGRYTPAAAARTAAITAS